VTDVGRWMNCLMFGRVRVQCESPPVICSHVLVTHTFTHGVLVNRDLRCTTSDFEHAYPT
jgi:hypothetical protein